MRFFVVEIEARFSMSSRRSVTVVGRTTM